MMAGFDDALQFGLEFGARHVFHPVLCRRLRPGTAAGGAADRERFRWAMSQAPRFRWIFGRGRTFGIGRRAF
jgi:hypothetical protein